MVEFISEARKSPRLVTLIVAVVVFSVGLGAILVYVRHQQDTQPVGTDAPVVIEGMVRPGDPDFEYYRHRVRISDVRASLGINFAKSRIAIINGNFSNEGDRTLEAFEVHVALFDLYDKLSTEKTATPIRPGIGFYKPLKPMETRSFTVWIEPIEQLWNPRRIQLELTGLKFQQR